ncbi:hypothetical protein N9L68_06680 [bacterium]|nr:hypothetical protein [bacterium]
MWTCRTTKGAHVRPASGCASAASPNQFCPLKRHDRRCSARTSMTPNSLREPESRRHAICLGAALLSLLASAQVLAHEGLAPRGRWRFSAY